MEHSYDAVVVLGRSIGKNKKGEWKPSPYFGAMAGGRPVPHSGVYDNRINPNAEGVMVAGGNTCALAAAYLVSEQTPPVNTVIFAAGRTGYIEKAAPELPDLSEGSVLEEKFSRKLSQKGIKKPETVILSEDQSTMDDMVNSIQEIRARGLNRIAYITVGIHVRRSAEFLHRRVPAEMKEGLEIDFLPAEAILGNADPRYAEIFKRARKTAAYRRTGFYERRGTKALIAGNY